jgi:hypothetical protein
MHCRREEAGSKHSDQSKDFGFWVGFGTAAGCKYPRPVMHVTHKLLRVEGISGSNIKFLYLFLSRLFQRFKNYLYGAIRRSQSLLGAPATPLNDLMSFLLSVSLR